MQIKFRNTQMTFEKIKLAFWNKCPLIIKETMRYHMGVTTALLITEFGKYRYISKTMEDSEIKAFKKM